MSILLSIPLIAKAEHLKNIMGAMDISPYGFKDENGKDSGIIYDILVEAAKRRGGGGIVEIIPIKRLIKYMREGHIACSVFFDSDFVKNNFEEIASLNWKVRSAVYARKGFDLKSYESLIGATVAITRGTSFSHQIDTDQRLEKVLTKGYEQSVMLLKAGRVDALVGTDASILYLFKKHGVDISNYPAPLILNEKTIHVWCSKGMLSESEKKSLREAVKSMRQDGTLESITEKYLN